MNVRKKWKPGGRQRGRTVTVKGVETRRKDNISDQSEQVEAIPPLVPRKVRKEE
ncbi:MAG: hypothetical protein H6Q60_634 [Oscillospiraceae bacterium]|nr:hypothetical protein [Oscillospiraceae bacterium]